MYKRNLFRLVGIVMLIVLFVQVVRAEDLITIDEIFEISLTGLDYTPIQSVRKDNLQQYYSYLPFLTIDDDGACQITLGGSVTNLFRNRNQEIKFFWEGQVFQEYDKRVQLIQVAAHLYNRAVYYKHEQELYKSFIEQVIPLYHQLEAEGTDYKKLAEFRVEIELKQYALVGKIKSLQELVLSLNDVTGKEVKLTQISDSYPEKIMQSFKMDYANLLAIELRRLDYSIEQMEMQIKSIKRSKYPDVNVRYSCSFGPDYDELDHRLEVNLSDFFNLTNYGEIDYNSSYRVNMAQGSDGNDPWVTNYDDSAQLTLYPYPRYRDANAGLKDLEKELDKMKSQRESSEFQKEQSILSELDKISHFYTMYHINLGKEVVFEDIQQLSLEKQIEILIARLDYQLEQEEYYFNFSYLHSFFKRNNQEGEMLLQLFSTDQ